MKTKTENKTFTKESEATAYWNSKSSPTNVSNEVIYNKDGTYTVETVTKEN